MTDKLIMTTEQRDQVMQALTIPHGNAQAAKDMLQSLPMVTGEPVNNTFLTTPELSALTRFCETCEDGEGYDVPKPMMHRLAQIGVVRHVSRGIYAITEFGQSVVEPSPKALAVQGEPVSREKLLGAIGRAWCHQDNSHKVLDEAVSFAVCKEIQALNLYTSPQALTQPAGSEAAEFAGWLVDKHEQEIIYEERLIGWLADWIKNRSKR